MLSSEANDRVPLGDPQRNGTTDLGRQSSLGGNRECRDDALRGRGDEPISAPCSGEAGRFPGRYFEEMPRTLAHAAASTRVPHDESEAAIDGVKVEQIEVAVVPLARLEVLAKALDTRSNLVFVEQREAGDASANVRLEIGMRSPPVGPAEPVKAVVRHQYRLDAVGLNDFGDRVDAHDLGAAVELGDGRYVIPEQPERVVDRGLEGEHHDAIGDSDSSRSPSIGSGQW